MDSVRLQGGVRPFVGGRASAGFTVMELLSVVAVLVAVIAIAAPNLSVMARSAEMNRLDNYAKEIYVALQDQFVQMEPTGEYLAFNQAVLSAEGRSLGRLGAMPPDAPNNEWRNYYYLDSFGQETADGELLRIMERTSVIEGLTRAGHYIVEVNPRPDGTDVYSVFYSEDPAFSYSDVENLVSREQRDRLDTQHGAVGYYCGISATGDEIPDRFAPRATMVNGEELFLNVFCQGGLGLLGSESGITVRIDLSDGSSTETIELYGGQDFHLNAAGNIDFDVVLDSLRPGMHLEDIAPTFQPGADITAVVDVECAHTDGTVISTPMALRGQAQGNSLYSKNADGLIEVANVRHLANLAFMPAGTFSVRQTADIDFDAGTWGSSSLTELSAATKAENEADYATSYVNPLDTRTDAAFTGFSPIQTFEGDEWAYDGQGNVLKNFLVSGSGPTGLFSTVQAGQVVSNVTLVDTVVEGAGPAGALAGVVLGRVEGCGARLDIRSGADAHKQASCLVNAVGDGSVGGLVGEAFGQAVIERCYAAVDVVGPEAPATGGLVGSFAGLALSTSYSSGTVDGGGATGGLVGSFSGDSLQDCYSTSEVNSGAIAGGLVGVSAGMSLWDCTSYGRVSVDGGNAFAGSVDGTDIQGCSCLVQTDHNDSGSLSGLPQGVSASSYSDLASMRLGSDHSHPYLERLMGTAFPFRPVLEEHWGNWPVSVEFHPTLLYYEHYADGSYGYFGTLANSANTYQVNTLDETLVVSDDGYAIVAPNKLSGFDYSTNDGETYRATLGDAPAVGTFIELPTVAPPAQYASAEDGGTGSEGGGSEDGEVIVIGDGGTGSGNAGEGGAGEGYEEPPVYYLYRWDGEALVPMIGLHVYQLPFDLQMPSREARSFYDRLDVTMAESDGVSSTMHSFFYNPDFAKMAVGPGTDGQASAPADPDRLLVRTARQLNCLGYQPFYWDATVAQDRDIDFGYYSATYLGHAVDLMDTAGPYANQPIGLFGRPFAGTYDGGNYAVIDYNLNASGQMAGGLFGCVSGTVRNVHLAASKVYAASVVRTGGVPSSHTPSLGALVGLVDGGTVEGCSVSGYRVTFESSASVASAVAGGLVGLNQGSVVRSTAANVAVANNAPSNTGAVLGIGGLAGGSAGAVHSSYAVENILTCSTTTSGSGRTIAYGGLVGASFDGSPEVGNCYSYAYATSTVCSPDDTVGYFAVTNPSLMNVHDCYYLDTEEPYEDGDGAVRCDPAALQNASLADMTGGTSGRATYGETVAGHVAQQSASYPYPVVCRNSYGDLAHYGFDWRE